MLRGQALSYDVAGTMVKTRRHNNRAVGEYQRLHSGLSCCVSGDGHINNVAASNAIATPVAACRAARCIMSRCSPRRHRPAILAPAILRVGAAAL